MSDDDKPPSSGDSSSGDRGRRVRASVVGLVGSWLRKGLGRGNGTSWRESLGEILAEEEIAEQISPHERDLLLNLLRFGGLTAEDAMVPRNDITAVDVSAPLHEVVATIKEKGHSRMPLYRGDLDDIVGMIHIRDVMSHWGEDGPFDLDAIRRDILFVPESMPIPALLKEMRETRLHMAVIVDEYGGTHGLVTIEDVVEEIVGEIEDEHDEIETPALVHLDDGAMEADARVRVDELERHVDLRLLDGDEEDAVDTLGGLVFTLAERVPRTGERIRHPAGLTFDVLEADPRRIKRLRVSRTGTHPAHGRL
ncbi:MAG: hemolysin family protein [Rhodospirillales bacterium]|nr:hemolysin family protein [Rhodospirillales bacterium]MDE0378952.1 hemolysin family protein [Rhodospirillales bacterium]